MIEGVKKSPNLCDVINGRPLIQINPVVHIVIVFSPVLTSSHLLPLSPTRTILVNFSPTKFWWKGGWVSGIKAVLRIAYCNQKRMSLPCRSTIFNEDCFVSCPPKSVPIGEFCFSLQPSIAMQPTNLKCFCMSFFYFVK